MKEKIIKIFYQINIPQEVSNDLVKYFLKIQHEIKINELEKSSVGKFVETIVQMFQSLDPKRKGNYDKSVKDVDKQVRDYESKSIPQIPNESRIAILRIARAIYCLKQ